jgi:hypothetical protein
MDFTKEALWQKLREISDYDKKTASDEFGAQLKILQKYRAFVADLMDEIRDDVESMNELPDEIEIIRPGDEFADVPF